MEILKDLVKRHIYFLSCYSISYYVMLNHIDYCHLLMVFAILL